MAEVVKHEVPGQKTAAKAAPKVAELPPVIEELLRQASGTAPSQALPANVVKAWLKWKGHFDRVAGGGFVQPRAETIASIMCIADLLAFQEQF